MLRMFTKDKVRFVNISDNKIHTWMTAAFPVFLLLAFSLHAKAQTASARMVESCKEFNELNANIRDGKITKTQEKDQLRALIDQIRNECYASTSGQDYRARDWVFPLKGYGYKAIDGVNGNGYQKRGYDYFDGNRHRGHPSQDIFIHDKKNKRT